MQACICFINFFIIFFCRFCFFILVIYSCIIKTYSYSFSHFLMWALFKYGQIPASFCSFSSFSHISNVKAKRCAWDSTLELHRRIHVSSFATWSVHLCSLSELHLVSIQATWLYHSLCIFLCIIVFDRFISLLLFLQVTS